MRFTAWTVVAAATLVGQRGARAADTASERLLVLQLAATGIATEVSKNLSEVFAAAIREAMPKAEVLGQSEIDNMLAMERQRDLVGCADNISCLAEVGGALGADYLAAGSIGKVGATYTLNLKLLNTRAAKTVRHVSKDVSGSEDLLIEATRQWGAHLVDPTRAAGTGYLTVLGQGEVLIDGQSRGRAPLERLAVAAGSHAVEWVGAGGARHKRDVRVAAYTAMEIGPGEIRLPVSESAALPPRPPWRAAVYLGRLGTLSRVNAELGTPDPITLDYSGSTTLGGRLGYLSAIGLQPFVAFERRKLSIKSPNDGLFVSAPPAELQQWAPAVGLAYSTAGRLRVLPSIAFEVIAARLVSSRDSIEGDTFRDRVADGLKMDTRSDMQLGLHFAADVLYSVSPELDVGVRAATQMLLQATDHVTYTADVVVDYGF